MAGRRPSQTGGSSLATRFLCAEMVGFVAEAAVPNVMMIDATYLKARWTATDFLSRTGD